MKHRTLQHATSYHYFTIEERYLHKSLHKDKCYNRWVVVRLNSNEVRFFSVLDFDSTNCLEVSFTNFKQGMNEHFRSSHKQSSQYQHWSEDERTKLSRFDSRNNDVSDNHLDHVSNVKHERCDHHNADCDDDCDDSIVSY